MSWYLEKVGNSVFVWVNGFRLSNRNGDQAGEVVEANCGKNGDEILFRFKDDLEGKRLRRSLFVSPNQESFSESLLATKTNGEFLKLLCESTFVTRGQTKKRTSDSASTTGTHSKKRLLMPQTQQTDVDCWSPEQEHRNQLDIETENCYIGRYDISVMTLLPPPEELKCRCLNMKWVKQIKESLKSTKTRTFVTLPCLIDPKQISNREDFLPERLDDYTKFTLGGNHLRTALQEFLQENHDGHFDALRGVNVDLYAGLTNSQARRLGNLHNIKTATLKPTMMDSVRLCRRILFEMGESDMESDEPPTASAHWKTRCHTELAGENKTMGSLTTIFHLAKYSRRCWKELEEISQSEINTTSDGQCDLKQPAFQTFQGLSEPYRYQLLKKVTCGELSLREAGNEANVSKKIDTIKSAFNRLTHCSSWDEAREKYPYHSDENRLKEKFLATRFDRKHVPQDFAAWCSEAVNSPSSAGACLSVDQIDVDIAVCIRGQSLTTHQRVLNICDKYREKIKQEISKITDIGLLNSGTASTS